MTQPGDSASSSETLHPEPADDRVGDLGPAASTEGSDSPTPPARFRRKAVVIAIATIVGLALFGSGVGTGIAISGSRTGATQASNAGSGNAFRLPAKLLGLDRNTYVRSDNSGWPKSLIARTVSGTYGAALPHTHTINIVGGRLTPAAQSEARIAPADMALSELQFRGSTDAQKFPAGATGAGVACANWTEPSYGMVIVCFSIDRTTVFEAIYIGGAASSLPDAAAKTVQIRQDLER
jgi:hypothetical protein